MKKLVVLFFSLNSFTLIFSQHLPMQISNQWHYEAVIPGMNHAAIAVSEEIIANKSYFKFEKRHYNNGTLLETTYDRLEGDSCYYRYINGSDYLIINFNWPDGFTQVIQIDSNCVQIIILAKGFINIWGQNVESYNFWSGFWCVGQPDTLWALTPMIITKKYGSYYAQDGYLIGAIINDTTYGILHPLPVELLSFFSSVIDNDVTLSWTTATETNNSGFEIERREKLEARSEEWKIISFVNGHGTTTESQTYFYKDEKLSAGKYQYRLKQIDFDGTFEYSKTIEVEINPLAKFSLEQNYPNPFNPSTKISWQSPVSGWQTLKVFDVLGNEVATLVNEFKPAGNYDIEFDATKLSSGVYYYQLKAGEFVQTRKMIFLN